MSLVRVQFDEGIALMTLDNPPVNVLSIEMANDIHEALLEVNQHDDTCALLVTGAGEKAFVAGGDIKEFPQFIEQNSAEQAANRFHETLQALHSLTIPTVAVMRGHALGGGCELALACDFRIVERHCLLGFPEITLGVFPGAGGTQRLARLVGVARAKRLILTGESIGAEQALAIGLVDEVAETSAGLVIAKKFVTAFQDKSRVALRMAKQAIDGGLDCSLADGLKLEARLFGQIFQSADAKEGVSAFLQKRRPIFTHQ